MFFRTACVAAILLSCVLEISLLQKACSHLLAPIGMMENLVGEQSELPSDAESDAEVQRDAWLHNHHSLDVRAINYLVLLRALWIESESRPPFSSRDPPLLLHVLSRVV